MRARALEAEVARARESAERKAEERRAAAEAEAQINKLVGSDDHPPPAPSSEPKTIVALVSEMVRVQGGCFWMGSPGSEPDRVSNEPRHQVCVDAFSMGKFEVTFAEYDRFAEATGRKKPGDEGWGRGRRPVIHVTREDATAYARWLSKETGSSYRLPTEAEWEYAARGGTTTSRYWGNDPTDACTYANVADQTVREEYPGWMTLHDCRDGHARTSPVGSYRANGHGLHDVLGNVWEWTCSLEDGNYSGWEMRCTSSGSGIRRGGSWRDKPKDVRSAARGPASGDAWRNDLGFRLARD